MLLKFDTAMEEYHKALQEKNYVVAAKQHGTVSYIQYALTLCVLVLLLHSFPCLITYLPL